MASDDLADARDQAVFQQDTAGEVQYVGKKRFVSKNGSWVDSDAADDKDVVKIVFLSDEYFELIEKKPESIHFLSLGENVTFKLDGKVYRIVSEK